MKSLKRLVLYLLYPLAKTYWFIRRPHTFGSKVILICEGEVLLIRHSYGGGNWTFPGGGIGKNETPEKAGIRELEEELGLKVATLKVVGQVKTEREYKRDTINVAVAEISPILKDNLVIDGIEVVEAKWFPVVKMPDLNELNQEIFSYYAKG